MNPYWAVNFDVTTGCDTHMRDGMRLIDTRCITTGPNETCSERFPDYYDYTTNKMDPYCAAHSDDMATARRGTFRRAPELCDKVPNTPVNCPRVHGSFSGTGRKVADLEHTHSTSSRFAQGIWDTSNSIFRGRTFSPETGTVNGLSVVDVLKVLPTDIAGHALEFTVTEYGVLRLSCMHLVKQATKECTTNNRHWMKNVEELWKYQHYQQERIWPDRSFGTPHPPANWKCPMQ